MTLNPVLRGGVACLFNYNILLTIIDLFDKNYNLINNAGVMELVDVLDSKSGEGNFVSVRVRPPANHSANFFRIALNSDSILEKIDIIIGSNCVPARS